MYVVVVMLVVVGVGVGPQSLPHLVDWVEVACVLVEVEPWSPPLQ